jgi:hypothetical protein
MLEEHFKAAVQLCSCEAVDENEFGPLFSVRCLIFGEEAATRLVNVVAHDENLESSKSPQSSSICNHNLARGDLLDSRLSVRTVYVLSSYEADVVKPLI